MRKAIQKVLAAAIAFLEKEEPKDPCVCIRDADDVHFSDCVVGPKRDQRIRWQEAAWVLEHVEDQMNATLSPAAASALALLRDEIHTRWGVRG